MRTERRGLGIVAAGGLLALIGLAYACGPTTTRPETVLSGNPGFGGGGMSSAPVEPDGGSGDEGDASEEVEAGAVVACSVPTANECSIITSSAGGEVSCPGGNLGTTCSSAELVGCCRTSSGTTSTESCFYGTSTVTTSTQQGCTNAGGAWSTTM